MNLIHLKYFFDAAKIGSLSGSAKANFVSQSAVSQGIFALEKSLKKQLITHTRNRMRLTQAGEQVLAHARRVFHAVSDLEEALASADPLARELRFGATHSIASALVLDGLTQMPPQTNICLRPGHIPVLAQWVSSGELEFALVGDTEDFSPFETEVLLEGSFGIFSREPLEELTACITTEPRPEVHQLHRLLPHLKTQARLSSWQLIAEAIQRGLGPGFLPDYFLAQYPFHRHEIPSIPYRILLIKQPHEPLSEPAELLLAMIREGAYNRAK